MADLENIVSKSEKIKKGLFPIYPIFCLSAISSLVGFGFSNSFNLSTSISAGSGFYLGFSKDKSEKITSFSILTSTYMPNIMQYFSEGQLEDSGQQLGAKIATTLILYSLGSVLKK